MKAFQLKHNFQVSLKHIPAIFLYHSKEDEIVPIDHLSYYKNVFKTAVVHILKGNEHSFTKGLPELVADITSL